MNIGEERRQHTHTRTYSSSANHREKKLRKEGQRRRFSFSENCFLGGQKGKRADELGE